MTTVPQPNTSPLELGREILAAALELAAAGVRVFPVWGVKWVKVPRVSDGDDGGVVLDARCGCGLVACANPAKHPVGSLVRHGHNDSATDLAQVRSWFDTQRLEAGGSQAIPYNLGVATGRGLVVIDADTKQTRPDLPNGLEVLDDFETWTAGVSLPWSKRSRTGGGGLHLWYAVEPGLRIPARNRVLPGIDVKGDGGYVLAPPSVHIRGGRYEWLDEDNMGWGPAGPELQTWLLSVKGGRYITRRAGDGGATEPDGYDFARCAATGCPAGHRDYFANDLAFRLRRRGLGVEEAAGIARREWLRMEQPPGDEFEWDAMLYKLRRVWDEVRPEDVAELPAWRPHSAQDSGEAGFAESAAAGPGDGEQPGPGVLEMLNRPDLTFRRSDTGNGERFAQRMREVARFCTGEDSWYLWEDGYWRRDDLNRALHWTQEIIKDLYEEAARVTNDAQRDLLESWAQQSQSAGKREAMLRMAGATPGMAIRADDLDTDPWILVVRNGTLDLRTGVLRESSPADLCTKRAEVAYDGDARCPLWLKHMEFITGGDAQLASYIQQAAGYTLTGLTTEQKIFFLWGTGGNGKSTFIDTVAKLLGSYATQADEELLTSVGGHPTQLADLRGARLVVCDETDREKKLAEQRIKMMTGKTIKARFMKQDFFEFTPRFKLWVSGNHKPEIRGGDEGIWRRLKLVPFTSKFTDDQRILGYDDILAEELPGILNWMLTGLAQWQETGGLGEVEVVKRATKEYRDEEDLIGAWLEEAVVIGDRNTCEPAGRLYDSYRWWCHANGHTPVSNVVLGRDLGARGLKKEVVKQDGKAVRVWHGVRLQTES